MRVQQSIFAGVLMMLSALPGISATLTVTGTATPDAGLYDYSYKFSVTGAGANVDNIFLGSDDLSPLNVVLDVNGSPTTDWSWLGNDTPENYLQFFDIAGTALGNGDALDVTFSSALVPGKGFALGVDSSTGGATNRVTGVTAPSSVVTPEPGSLLLLISGVALLPVARRYAGRVRR
jgi:hypothetical protein